MKKAFCFNICPYFFPWKKGIPNSKSDEHKFFQGKKYGQILKQNAFFIYAGFFVELHTKEVIAMTANGHTELGKILFQKHNFFKNCSESSAYSLCYTVRPRNENSFSLTKEPSMEDLF